MALIELREVTKRYRVGEQEIRALDGIDLTIEQGEYAAIIGPSGSGKSTLMHLLGCLDTPTTGKVVIDGVDVSRASDGRLAEMRTEKIGFVFQSFNLLGRFNVLENVELPMIYSGVSKKERRDRAIAAVDRVGLMDRAKNTPLQLSGGQMQRVAIARALAMEPVALLCDEITSALDPELVGEVLRVIESLAEAGMTLLMVTHEMRFARKVSDRVVFMHAGRVHEIGTPEKLFGSPETAELKQFLSSLHA